LFWSIFVTLNRLEKLKVLLNCFKKLDLHANLKNQQSLSYIEFNLKLNGIFIRLTIYSIIIAISDND